MIGTTGGWRDIHLMSKAVERGDINMCGLGRPLQEDPDFVRCFAGRSSEVTCRLILWPIQCIRRDNRKIGTYYMSSFLSFLAFAGFYLLFHFNIAGHQRLYEGNGFVVIIEH